MHFSRFVELPLCCKQEDDGKPNESEPYVGYIYKESGTPKGPCFIKIQNCQTDTGLLQAK